jgi:23S rRNA (cytidine1920-2'-O)/16S rRNA (cytidine1409-2'-O)-methyltransferase
VKPKKERVDSLVVRLGLAQSRAQAQALILAGQVLIGDQRADKPGSLVPSDALLHLKEKLPYVSRGGVKLAHALSQLGFSVEGKLCADIGASTGGFTDCLLQAGARKVYAIDVGRGQLHPKLAADFRVVAREKINARYLTAAELPEPIDVATVDVSFISLTKVLPALLDRLAPGGAVIALVKPQFEAGRASIGKGGVVKDPLAREESIQKIVAFLEQRKMHLLGRVDSPIAGPAGNLEAFVAAVRSAP